VQAAQQATTATSMVRTLLVGTFSMTVLLSSNLKGGRSTRPGEEKPVHTALDETSINAIYCEYSVAFQTLSEFKDDYHLSFKI
jgi:hypothetical protein